MKNMIAVFLVFLSSNAFAETIFDCRSPSMPAVRARLVYDAGEGLDQSAIKQIFIMDNFAQGKNISCSPRELYYIGETANWSCTGAWGGLSEPLQAEIHQTVGLGFWFMLKRPTEYGGNWVKLKCKKAL